MKCEPCGFQEKPDNINKLKSHVETCSKVDLDKVKIIWRNSEMTAGYKPKKLEHQFQVELKKLASAPRPPKYVQRTYTPKVVQEPMTPEVLEEINKGQALE